MGGGSTEGGSGATKHRQSPTLRRDLGMFIPIVCLIVILDQVTKYLARIDLVVGSPVHVIPGLFDFQLVFNRGAAFGLMQNATVYFLVIAVIIIGGSLLYLCLVHGHTRFEVVSLALICAGAMGNGIDRLFMGGTVTDFIATVFMDFPVFNVADCAITIGCVCFVIICLFLNRHTPSDDGKPSDDGEDR